MLEFRISGLVQGVNFRSSTAKKAKELSLRGWVKNEPDETVSGVAAGSEDQLEKL